MALRAPNKMIVPCCEPGPPGTEEPSAPVRRGKGPLDLFLFPPHLPRERGFKPFSLCPLRGGITRTEKGGDEGEGEARFHFDRRSKGF